MTVFFDMVQIDINQAFFLIDNETFRYIKVPKSLCPDQQFNIKKNQIKIQQSEKHEK
jgi:hypothetical protein